MRGANASANGNIVLHFKLQLPDFPLSKKQVQLIEEFDRISTTKDGGGGGRKQQAAAGA